MGTTIDIDDRLLGDAMRLSGIGTKKAVVEAALRLLIGVKGQTGIRRLKGNVRWEETGEGHDFQSCRKRSQRERL